MKFQIELPAESLRSFIKISPSRTPDSARVAQKGNSLTFTIQDEEDHSRKFEMYILSCIEIWPKFERLLAIWAASEDGRSCHQKTCWRRIEPMDRVGATRQPCDKIH